ncbi:MAG TPA: hypothetical protein VM076_19055 [Gemmatimonadaceae bacterium]|nr:hypothetical protein [Gemmatimonadaceae bacterium]
MNVHVRFFTVSAVAALATLAVGGSSLGAQSAPRAGMAAFATVGVAPSSLIAVSDTTTPADSATASTAPAEASATTAARGPSLSSARVASHAISKSRGAPPALQNRTSNRNSLALMIVGGAALVVGAVIGDDAGTLVMLGGAAVGLYGLYLFLT